MIYRVKYITLQTLWVTRETVLKSIANIAWLRLCHAPESVLPVPAVHEEITQNETSCKVLFLEFLSKFWSER